MNASTFTARVVASTGADCAAALSSAVGALSGPLHGGAPSRVLKMLDGREYLMGDELSAADCAAYPFLKFARGRDPADGELFHRILDERQSLDGRPRLAAWIERISRLPQV